VKRLAVPVLLLSAFSACASPRVDVIQVGPWFQPKHWKEVEVFSSRDETRKPWGAIALFHGEHIPGADPKAFEKQKIKARRLAADIGADAVILIPEAVNRTDVPLSAGEGGSGRVFLSGLALKYEANVSTAAIRNP